MTASADVQAEIGRLQALIDRNFQGNQADFARLLELSEATVSRALNPETYSKTRMDKIFRLAEQKGLQEMEEESPPFGQMIREAREKKGWTQEYVAQKVGVGNSTYRAYEYGDIKGVPWDKALKILRLLDLLERADRPKPKKPSKEPEPDAGDIPAIIIRDPEGAVWANVYLRFDVQIIDTLDWTIARRGNKLKAEFETDEPED